MIDYIHAPDCTCFTDPDGRAKITDDRAPWGSRSDADTVLPPGSCPGWLAVDGGAKTRVPAEQIRPLPDARPDTHHAASPAPTATLQRGLPR